MAESLRPPGDAAQPTDHDRENARIRQEIADRQAAEYAEVLEMALAAFGPGWLPSYRHCLIEKVCCEPQSP